MPNRQRKPVRQKSRPTRHSKPQRRPATPKAALMRIPAPPAQPWNLTLDEVTLVKNHIAKGASDTELQFCLAVARRHKLDPFRGQIWFVKRRDSSAEGGYRWIPIVGINGLLHIAARDHSDFGSNDEAEFGPMHTVEWQYNGQGPKKSLQAPEWARVKIWKKGHDHPIVSTVYWDEIYPNVDYAPLVRQMPRGQLEKCALAKGTRRAYPATDGLYIKEEFQGPPEFTPGGRVMTVESAEVDPAEQRYLEREKEAISKLTPAQQEVVKQRMAKSSQVTDPPAKAGAPATEDTGAALPPSLGYLYHKESDTWEIRGSAELKKKHWDLLGPLYSPVSKTLVANAKTLGVLISRFEDLKVPFREINA